MVGVQGLDLSFWQSEINWEKVKIAGNQFAILRAGTVDGGGNCYTDKQFVRNTAEAPKYMKAFGYYWYFRPFKPAVMQANYFYELIKNTGATIYPACDIEESNGLTPGTVINAVDAFLRRLETLGMKPMIYTSPGFYATNFIDKNILNVWVKKYPLWIANWKVSKPVIPKPYLTYKFWQWGVLPDGQENGMGIGSVSVDHDIYGGTQEQFDTEFCKDIPTPPENPITTTEKVDILWRESKIHNPDWNYNLQ